MLKLPHREELTVTVEGGATLRLAPFTDEQYFKLQETMDREGEGETMRLKFFASLLPGFFEDRIRGVDGVEVDGEPFDVSRPEHMARVPPHWKALAFQRLVNEVVNPALPGSGKPN
jgi:hypothetical protein